MEATEVTKMIDGVYKNILESFNPASRQMITTGKAYLKSLHGASAASSLYLDTLVRVSRQAQQSTLGNSGDIGSCLMQITEVFKEIHTLQLNTLKAFYVDFLVPLETNLEQDTRVIQTEQKKFMVSHKQRMESYNKAASTVKKIRKKSKKSNPSAATLDKEIKVMQNMEEERSKLEAFCDKSIKDALTQERRRYGFILERQASLAKHYLAFYSKGSSHLNAKLESWLNVAKARESLPECVQNSLLKRIQGGSEEECIYCSPRKPGTALDDTASISSQLRKTKSMDASEILNLQSGCGDMHLSVGPNTISRAKSEVNLVGSGGGNCGGNCNFQESFEPSNNIVQRPKSLAVASESTNNGYAKALYAYLSSGDNQLSFLEGDILSLIGERNKGWQFGENLRTQKTGWFPVAYTEVTPDLGGKMMSGNLPETPPGCGGSNSIPPPVPTVAPLPPSVVSMNNMNMQQSHRHMTAHGHSHGTYSPTSSSNSSTSTFHQRRLNLADVIVHRTPESMRSHPTTPSGISAGKMMTSPVNPECPNPVNNNLNVPGRPQQQHGQRGKNPSGGGRPYNQGPNAQQCASDSLHSSNDSGFSNDGRRVYPPPQPDIDYSDDDSQLHNSARQAEIRRQAEGDSTPPVTGDAWLMERYHMSESIRVGGLGIGGITRRRSLSFSNVSGVGTTPRVPVRSSSRDPAEYKGRHELPHANYNNQRRPVDAHTGLQRRDTALGIGKEDGAIKKFLNRTKSLIWKRNGLDRIDSISCAGSSSSLELWRSHASLIDTSCDTVECTELTGKNSKNFDNDNDTIIDEVQHDLSKIHEIDDGTRHRSLPMKEMENGGNVPPPLPPFPPGLAEKGVRKSNRNHQNNKATSTTSSLQNLSEVMSTDDTLERRTIGPLDNESCIFISDHAKQKGSQRSGRRSTKSSDIGCEMRSKKIQANIGKSGESENSVQAYRQRSASNPKMSSRQHDLQRRESLYDIEAPIVPIEMNVGKVISKTKSFGQVNQINSSTRGDSGSIISSNQRRSSKSKGSKNSGGNRRNESKANVENGTMSTIGFEKSIQTSRTYIIAKAEEKSRKYMYTSDEDKEAELDVDEYDVDEEIIDFDEEENGIYEDNEIENASSVFIADMDDVNESCNMDGSQTYSSLPSRGNTHVHESRSFNHQDMIEVVANASLSVSREEKSKSKRESSKSNPGYMNGDHSSNANTGGRMNGGHKESNRKHYEDEEQCRNGHGTCASRKSESKKNPNEYPSEMSSSGSGGRHSKYYNGSEERHNGSGNRNGHHQQGGSNSNHASTPSRKSSSAKAQGKDSRRSREFRNGDSQPHNGSGSSVADSRRGNEKLMYDYSAQIHRRLYYPERTSKLDQKSERSGNLCGPWYDLWGEDPPVPCK